MKQIKNKNMFKKSLILLVLPVLLASCKSGRDRERVIDFKITDEEILAESYVIPEDFMMDVIYNFSSIIEIPAFLKSLDIPFSEEHLAQTGRIESYENDLRRAFILGVFASDLGYMNMYDKTETVSDYVASISQLADSLSIGQYFDFSGFEEMLSSPSFSDSLMFISMYGFNRADRQLREEKRTEVSTSMIAGVWLEGLYLLTRAAQAQPDAEIFEMVGEQKIILNDLFVLLRNFEQRYSEIEMLTKEFSAIKEIFDKVSIMYEIGEPVAVERDGMLMIIQNEYSSVDITLEQVKSISEKTETVRNQLILL